MWKILGLKEPPTNKAEEENMCLCVRTYNFSSSLHVYPDLMFFFPANQSGQLVSV